MQNSKVDFFFNKESQWQNAVAQLRTIALDCKLEETLKWGSPCYMWQQHNVVLIHCFKEYCALLIFKGALLKDEHGLLVQQSEHVQAARQLRFTSAGEVSKQAKKIKSYICQAIEVEKAGLKVPMTQSKTLTLAAELLQQFDAMPNLKVAFEALTPGRQRAYNLHFTGARQTSTRAARVEKCIPQILAGKGLNE